MEAATDGVDPIEFTVPNKVLANDTELQKWLDSLKKVERDALQEALGVTKQDELRGNTPKDTYLNNLKTFAKPRSRRYRIRNIRRDS